MKFKFSIAYKTTWGQSLFVSGSLPELGIGDTSLALKMTWISDGLWEVEIETDHWSFNYSYLIKEGHSKKEISEFGEARIVRVEANVSSVFFKDSWRSNQSEENLLYTSPFQKSFFRRETNPLHKSKSDSGKNCVGFQLCAPRVGADFGVGLLGNIESLGEWNEDKMILLDGNNYPYWQVDVDMDDDEKSFEYKYVIYSLKGNKIVAWETDENRFFERSYSISNSHLTIISDEYFRYPVEKWRSAGVSIPVFSLRTKSSSGVGEFSDIKKLVDWSVQTGLKVIQVLPVNDTVASHTWVDSYPYAAISVQALHPIYANLQSIGKLKDKKLQKSIETEAQRLNLLPELDYELVMKLKSDFFKYSFDENKLKFLNSSELSDFVSNNKSWIVAYAVFSFLRDKFKTPDFNEWGEFKSIWEDQLIEMAGSDKPEYEDIAIHYYIQYHLDKQLKEATEYARNNGVVLKGDIPIGIYRNSVDAWRSPHLFNMSMQTGAPPDDFSTTGQNWGFPTYNWEEMSKDNYSWWSNRMRKMSEYFDVFRIDHILGFFRIWEIPWKVVEGTLGHFNKSLPLTQYEIESWGISFDFDRLCKPYIAETTLEELFGNYSRFIKDNFLEEDDCGVYHFLSPFNSQRKIKEYTDLLIEKEPNKKKHFLWQRDQLYRLIEEVIFLPEEENENTFNPRISLHQTYSYQALDEPIKQRLNQLYNHYFYERHNEFWRAQSMKKLPMLKKVTDMLICGEDLGMVPASVPGVMDDLQILSLAIQRMPNDQREFWNPADTKYLSVTSTSSHDVSTLREWWTEDREQTQRFFNHILGIKGETTDDCEPWVVEAIIKQHLESPSMFAVFPIQDLLAMDEKLRREDFKSERINVPKIINYYWKYRLHIYMEDLIKQSEFNNRLKQVIDTSGRLTDH